MDSTIVAAAIGALALIVGALIGKRRGHGQRPRRPGDTRRGPEPPAACTSSHKLGINYEYNDLGCPVGAKAYLDDHYLIGEAHMIALNKRKDIHLEETHYSLSHDGTVAYEGFVWFGIPGGFKLRESPKGGHKQIEIFDTWPI